MGAVMAVALKEAPRGLLPPCEKNFEFKRKRGFFCFFPSILFLGKCRSPRHFLVNFYICIFLRND